MSDIDNTPIKVTDLVQKSLDMLNAANTSEDPKIASRHMQSARIFADLSESQGVKTANIIAYLNSDRSKWSETDESIVRTMLGLDRTTPGDDTGGANEPLNVDTDPEPPTAAVTDEASEAVEPDMFAEVETQEPSFV